MAENTWGAFVKNYKPNKLVSSSLEKYLVSILVKTDSSDSSVVKGREVYYENLERHFARLTDFLNSEEEDEESTSFIIQSLYKINTYIQTELKNIEKEKK